MDIHKPKAPHSWGELAREVGTIVIGILIALSLEEGLRILHDRHVAQEARQSVRAEIEANLKGVQMRMATQDCVAHRLDEIGALLAQAQEGPVTPRPQWVGQPAIPFMATQLWQAATASGRASLFETEEQGRYATVYVATNQFALESAHEQDAWTQLRALETWTGPLGPAGRVRFSEALQQARYALWATRVNMELALKAGNALGIAPPRPKDVASVPHAICLPIGTPRADALKVLNADDFGQPQ